MIEALKGQIEHEKVMLENWKRGDYSVMPKNWCIAEQWAFIRGMEVALDIISEPEEYV